MIGTGRHPDVCDGRATLRSASMRIVRLLVGRPPVSVRQLTREAETTRTAVVEHLKYLIASGLVERHIEQLPGRGRPHYVYSLTPASLPCLFSCHGQSLVPAILNAIRDVGGEDLFGKLTLHCAAEMARHYRARNLGKTEEQHVYQMAKVLRAEGHVADVDRGRNGVLVFRSRSCPFISAVDDTRFACRVGVLMMRKLFGCRVRQRASRLDGAPCCVFEIYLKAP